MQQREEKGSKPDEEEEEETGGGPAGRQAGRQAPDLKQLWSPPNLPFSLCCNKCSMQQPISLFRYFQALVSPICSSQQPITFIGYFQALVSPICSSQQPISLFGYFQALVSPICNSHVLLLANHSLLFLVGTLSVSCRNPETSLPLSLSLSFVLSFVMML